MTFSNLQDLAFSALCTTLNTDGVKLFDIDLTAKKMGRALNAGRRKQPWGKNVWQSAHINLNGCDVSVCQVTRPDHSRSYCLTYVRKNGQDLAPYNV